MAMQPFQKKVWLSTPTMHGEEQKWVEEAIRTNWVSTVGENINEVERLVTEKIGRRYAVGLSNGTAALHLAIRLAGERLQGVVDAKLRMFDFIHLPHAAAAQEPDHAVDSESGGRKIVHGPLS